MNLADQGDPLGAQCPGKLSLPLKAISAPAQQPDHDIPLQESGITVFMFFTKTEFLLPLKIGEDTFHRVTCTKIRNWVNWEHTQIEDSNEEA